MAYRRNHEGLYDKCACGRKKLKSEYVCQYCYNRGHPNPCKADARRHRLNRNEKVVVVSCPDGTISRGAEFDASQFGLASFGTQANKYTTLGMGNWPDGMVIRHGGRSLVVMGKQTVEVEQP